MTCKPRRFNRYLVTPKLKWWEKLLGITKSPKSTLCEEFPGSPGYENAQYEEVVLQAREPFCFSKSCETQDPEQVK